MFYDDLPSEIFTTDLVDYAAMSYFRFAVKVAKRHCHSDDLGKCCLEEVS